MSWISDRWNDVCKFGSDFGNNFVDGFKDAGELFEYAGEALDDGNYLGAFHRGVMGTATGLANTITLGGAHKLGELASDNIENGGADESENILDGIGDAASKVVEYCAKNEAESALMQDDLMNGQYTEYEYNKDTHSFDVAKDADGNAKTYNAETDEQREKFRTMGRVMGGVDAAGDIVDLATLGWGGKAVSVSAKTAAREGAEEVVEQAAKQTVKRAAKETTEEIAEQGAKRIAKDVAEETVEQTVKNTTKEALQETAEQTAKQVVKETVKDAAETAAEKTVRNAAKDGAKKVTLSEIKDGLKNTIFNKPLQKGAALYVNDRLINGKTYADKEMHGTAYAATDAAVDITANAVSATKSVAEGTLNSISDSFLSRHPKLGKFINTCRAGAYAAAHSLTNTQFGAGAVALVVKPFDFMKSKVMNTQGDYTGKSVTDVAKELHEKSTSNGESFTSNYVAKVKELDERIGLDPYSRRTVAEFEGLVAADNEQAEDNIEFSPA